MLKLMPSIFLGTDSAIRKGVDELAGLVAERKKLVAREEQLKARLIEIAAERKTSTVEGNNYVAQVSVEYQKRFDTTKLRASLRPEDVAKFEKSTRVVKVITTPQILDLPIAAE